MDDHIGTRAGDKYFITIKQERDKVVMLYIQQKNHDTP